MGQQLAGECQCHDGFLQLCVPEAPSNEQHTEISDIPPPPPPGFAAYGVPTEISDIPAPQRPCSAVPMNFGQQGDNFQLTPEERSFIGAPAPQEDCGAVSGLPPPSPSGRSPAPRSPGRNVTHDDILSNLEGSEEALYGDAFSMFVTTHSGLVGLDSAAMRDFILANSVISMDDIDLELLKVASPDEGLSQDAFLGLLREFPVSESHAISNFMDMSENGETVPSEECRTGLLLFAQERAAGNFTEEKWERVLNTVMCDAGVAVELQQWIAHCKCIGRIVRLFRYAQVRKEASGFHGSNTAVIGGA